MTGEAAPPIPRAGRGPVVLEVLSRIAAADAFLPTLAALDRSASLLAARPAALAAAAIVGVPLARLLLPGGAALAAGTALLAIAGTALLLAGAAILHDGVERRIASRALVAGLLLRGILAAALTAVGGFPDERGYYDLLARDAAAAWAAGGESTLGWHPFAEGRWAYYALLSGAYLLVGPALEVGRLLGILVGGAAALVAGEIARPLGGRRAAAFAVALLALHPEHALWNATLSRDGLSTLLVLLALAVLLRPPGGLLRPRTLLAAGPLALLAANSLPTFAAAGAGILAAAVALDAASLRRGPGAAVRAGLAVALAAAAAAWLLDRHGHWIRPEGISILRSGMYAGDVGAPRADFLPGLRLEGWGETLLYLPAGISFVLLAPWPWDAVHLHRAAYAPLALGGAALALLGVAGLVGAARRVPRAAALPAATAALLLVELALLEGNSGILARHRLPLTAILAAGAGVMLAGLLPARAGAEEPAT